MANSTTAEHAVIRRDISKFKWTMMQVKQHKVAYLMIAPFFILFFIFTVVPVLLSIVLSFTTFNLLEWPTLVYADNYIRLRVNREGKEIFNKAFTKNHFRNYMEKGFISHAILEGMAFDKVDGNNLRFAASVSYPASDIYIPLSITISPDGSYQITKDEVLDTVVAIDSTETGE